MSGKNGGTGVGLVEGYDVDQAANSQLANISTRGFVETGNNVMIGGFILGGGGKDVSVVVRALGPSLTPFGVTGALADPTLELHDGNGALVQSNDNWKETQQTEIEATGLQPTDDLESAILQTLTPGAYTAIVSGSGGSPGWRWWKFIGFLSQPPQGRWCSYLIWPHDSLLMKYGPPITPALLRLDPIWDPLRGDLAFQELCEVK